MPSLATVLATLERVARYQITVLCLVDRASHYNLTDNPSMCTICIEKKNQLDASEWFIALIICSTCFGHLYAHRQELETICVLLPPMVCNASVAGGRRSGAGQPAMRPE